MHFEKLADYILVKTTFGFSLAWDGISGIYLKLSEEHRGKSCGLCANYNGIQSDDFVIHQGKELEHEKGADPLGSSSFGQQQIVSRTLDWPWKVLGHHWSTPMILSGCQDGKHFLVTCQHLLS